MQNVDHRLVEIALENTSGTEFEKFFHAFYPAIAGIEFVPLGGVRDGGADAFHDELILESQSCRHRTFYQASIQQDYRSKIRHTVNRLREFGRDSQVLHYLSSRVINNIDQHEEELTRELGVLVKIRDRKWITSNINRSPQTISAFETFLRHNVNFLSEIGGNTLITSSERIPARTMCVFLGQEIDRRRGQSQLLEAVTDSLILWALEDTDPEEDKLMARSEIKQKIEAALPSAKHFIRNSFDHRIQILTRKGNETGREVNWYRKDDKFCLPYETRKVVRNENMEDEFLKLSVMNVYKYRAEQELDSEDMISADKIADLVHRSLELTFENEGLDLAQFLTGNNNEDQKFSISDHVDKALEQVGEQIASRPRAKEVALAVLQQAFYKSTKEERLYYGKLSRTYALLFTLRNEPKIVEYFRGMSSKFVLFVGSDIIIRALSERYLSREDQMTVNMLAILRQAGSELILTQTAVEEIQSHLAASDTEFRHDFLQVEPYLDTTIARHASKILIRAYFYAKLDPLREESPKGWGSFVGQICAYEDLHNKTKSRRQVQHYLIEKFGFEYLDKDDLRGLVDEQEFETLANKLGEIKPSPILARNDARQILAVYGKRNALSEGHRANPYGYRTWWLTHETRVTQFTNEIVNEQGARYIMRPEFILNFIALSPTTAEIRKSYDTVFPTLLGVRLSNRMRENVFHDVMNRAKELGSVDDARVQVMMSDMSNRLKGDNYKEYEAELTNKSSVA